jgi:HD-GYP domain-containing protein (c-di-GMP phosphodiesterase class II)
VADAFDAMVSDRPYRAGMEPERAAEELRRGRGSQFDPGAVDVFLRLSEADHPALFPREAEPAVASVGRVSAEAPVVSVVSA